VLDGTLAVDNKATTTTLNSDGSTTASTPVAGRLGTLGEFHGVWLETTDAYGNNTGLDVLRIHDSKGTITLVFDNQNPGKAHPASHRASYFEDVERVYHDTGAFAGAAERGSIELVTNSDQSVITSLRLHTQNS